MVVYLQAIAWLGFSLSTLAFAVALMRRLDGGWRMSAGAALGLVVGVRLLFGGLFKSIVYGSLVAIAGCQQGMACGNSAMAVGQCTTKAVVLGIVLIVTSASILTVIYINLGI